MRLSEQLGKVNGFRDVALDAPDPVASNRGHAPDGVDRIIEVSFSDNVDLDAALAKDNVVIAAYARTPILLRIPD